MTMITSIDLGKWIASELVSFCTVRDRQTFQGVCEPALRDLIGHRALLAVIGKVANGQVSILTAINCGLPAELMSSASTGSSLADRRLIQHWLQTRQPLFVDAAVARQHASAFEREEIERYGLGCLAIHGVVDVSGAMGSYFSFCGVPHDNPEETRHRLELVVPHLHTALLQIWRAECADWAMRITPRERELLQCLAAGLSNLEVAERTGRSISTVRNQLHHLMGKFSASNRLQLIAKASEVGLLNEGLGLAARENT